MVYLGKILGVTPEMGMTAQSRNETVDLIRTALANIGFDTRSSESTERTPERWLKYILEFMQPYDLDEVLGPRFDAVHDNTSIHGMIIQEDIPYTAICLNYRMRVSTTSGYVPIGLLDVGAELYTLAGGRLVTTEVVGKTRVKKPLTAVVKVVGRSLPTICDPEHPFMTQRGYVTAQELLETDHIIGVNSKKLHRNKVEVVPGYSLGYVLGAISSDGFIEQEMHKRRVRLQVIDRSFAERFALHVKTSLGIQVECRPVMHQGGFREEPIQMYRVQFFDVDAIEKLVSLMGGVKRWDTVKVPDVVRTSPDIMQGYTEGYFDGDGSSWVDKRGIVNNRLLSNNRGFLQEMHEVGVLGKVQTNKQGQSYGRLLTRNKFTPDPSLEIPDLSLWPTETFRVERVDILKEEGIFYDIKCEPYPSFIVNGLHTHNCEHHLLPFQGFAHIGYIPDSKILGLSKFTRLVHAVSHEKPGLQEAHTEEIADIIFEKIPAKGAIVVIKAKHACMGCRGVNAPGVTTTTSCIRGLFRDVQAAREEFLSLSGLRG